jgi:hypothetical protein
MAITWNPSDVPVADAEDLASAMLVLIGTEHGLVLYRGELSREEEALVSGCLHERLGREPSRELAALMRFRALVQVFSNRRLNDLLLEHGYDAIAPAVRVAAEMRLNLKWGFNPRKFARTLNAMLDGGDMGADGTTRDLLDAA